MLSDPDGNPFLTDQQVPSLPNPKR